MKRCGSLSHVLQMASYWVEAFGGLEPATEVVGGDEVAKMLPELVVGFVVVAFDGRVLDRAVHSLDLAVVS